MNVFLAALGWSGFVVALLSVAGFFFRVLAGPCAVVGGLAGTVLMLAADTASRSWLLVAVDVTALVVLAGTVAAERRRAAR